ncbi:MAG TPA: ATP-dependent helicase [Niastella sp.]
MITIDIQKAQAFYAELALLQHATAETNERFSNLSGFFYKLIKAATNEEKIAFRNFYARFRYLLSQLKLTGPERQNLDAFRRFIKEGNNKKITPKSIQQGISLLYRLIKIISGDIAPQKQSLEDLAYTERYFLRLLPQRRIDTLTNLKVLCSSWTEITEDKGSPCFKLVAYDLENMEGQVEILIKAHPHADFMPVRQLLTKNAILQLHNIKFTGEADNQYTTTFDSLITLEPDFLVDATSIGECFISKGSNSDIFFLSKILDNLPGSPALKGSMVGYYLDELVRNKEKDIEAIYLTAQRNNALKAAQFGNTEMRNLKESILKEHLKNILTLVETQRDKELWIEPTYFSKEFGLQGRIDLLGINRELDSKDIVELKSGGPSNHTQTIAWSNHKMQVVSYDMLLQSTYGDNRQGANAVFYSKCTVSPYRNIVSEHNEKIDVLHIRNEIAAKIYQLANGDFSQLHKIKTEGIASLPVYKREELDTFRRFYDPTKITSQYYQELLAFTLREMINAKVGDMLKMDEEENQNGFAGLWLDNQLTKEQDFRILYDLEVKNINEENGHIHLTFDRNTSHSFRKGDLVILYPKQEDGYNPLTQHILKGTISQLGLDNLLISLFNIQTDYTFIKTYERWAIEPDILERNNWSTISSLFNVLSCADRKKRLLFGHIEPTFESAITYHNEHLTQNQNHVVQQALNANDYYLLQGPPGTGKTSTFLVNYVKEQTSKTKDKIVVLAFTNKAVEKICESFKKPANDKSKIDYIRLGSKLVTDENLFSEQLIDDNPDNWRKIIDSHQVIVSTVTTFQNNWLLLKEFISFKQVIIDEASQLTEAALAGILVLFDKFILIGDHKQLPSVVTQDAKTCLTQSKYLNDLGVTDLRISLFERLTRNAIAKGWKHTYGQLTHHYRMHQDIAALISQHYRETLITGLPKQNSKAAPYELTSDHSLYELTKSRTIFIESAPETALKKNKKEAYIAAFIAQQLIDTGIVKPSEIGIVTPFRAQIAEIKKYIRTDILKEENFIVDTVERYQGDERKIILFSSTITNPRQIPSMQSIAAGDHDETDRKLLVCISRASEQFIILGNAEVLRTSKPYRTLIAHMEARSGFLNKLFSENILSMNGGLMPE